MQDERENNLLSVSALQAHLVPQRNSGTDISRQVCFLCTETSSSHITCNSGISMSTHPVFLEILSFSRAKVNTIHSLDPGKNFPTVSFWKFWQTPVSFSWDVDTAATQFCFSSQVAHLTKWGAWRGPGTLFQEVKEVTVHIKSIFLRHRNDWLFCSCSNPKVFGVGQKLKYLSYLVIKTFDFNAINPEFSHIL